MSVDLWMNLQKKWELSQVDQKLTRHVSGRYDSPRENSQYSKVGCPPLFADRAYELAQQAVEFLAPADRLTDAEFRDLARQNGYTPDDDDDNDDDDGDTDTDNDEDDDGNDND